MKKKNISLLWSGGLDSTYLLYKLLKQGHNVKCIYIEIENNKEKTIRQQNAIKKMIDNYFHIYNIKYGDILQYKYYISEANTSYHFPPMFLSTMLYASHDTDEVSIGYVQNDDAISILEDIKRSWKTFKNYLRSPLPKLTFPLSKTGKIQIIEQMPKVLLKNITFCQGFKQNCGECIPCKRWNQLKDYWYPRLTQEEIVCKIDNEVVVNNNLNYIYKYGGD